MNVCRICWHIWSRREVLNLEEEKMGNEISNVGCIEVNVHPFEVDFRGKFTFPLLMNQLLNAAGIHANNRGFGISQLNAEDKTWVLSRAAIELYDYPKNEDVFEIRTWVEGLMRTFTLRNFEVVDSCGNVIGYARTVWAMIDMQSRKPVNLTELGIDKFIEKRDCPIERSGKIMLANDYTESKFSVKYSDVDINQHLNSAKYVEHIVDVFSLQDLREKDIRRFEIEYIEECHFGEEIIVRKSEITPNEFVVVLFNEQEEVVCKSRIFFAEKKD